LFRRICKLTAARGKTMKKALLAAAFAFVFGQAAQAHGVSFAISFPAARSAAPIDGRIVLLLATDKTGEPRMQVESNMALHTPFTFGLTVDGMKPDQPVTVDGKAFGWPLRSLDGLKPGDYIVQVVLNRYETFHRADGSVVKLPPDKGEGQQWNLKPGNLYSKPVTIHVDPASGQPVRIVLDQEIAPITPKTDSEFIRHVMIKSEMLSKYWGRPMYIGAHILLPYGFDKHPNAHFPIMVFHGHFPDDISEFSTTPPDPNLKPDYSERFHLAGYNRIQQQEAYAFYKKWISPGFPRFMVIEIEHANPYYDDSYAVNSANLGPYGDAINKELIPYIEKKYRGLGQGWARFTYGGSTGGWEALATQVFYPDMYNGAFAACPDPIDFHAFTVVNVYADKNAYALNGQALTIERPSERNYLGEILATQRDSNYQELVLGDRGRSTGQYDIWDAVFGPQGADGYPKPVFDKVTGDIDPTVAAYWRDHFDLTHIIQRDWATLGPKLAGKIHIYVGSADTYYLNDAVYSAQDVLQALKNPAYGGEVDYGDRAEHCWNGDHTLGNAYSRLHYDYFYLPKIMARMKATAPKGADLTSWRY
jgi:hypothetical protein